MNLSDEQQLTKELDDAQTRFAAFERLVREFSEPLYWHIRKIVTNHDDANDVLQNLFVKAWTHLDNFHHESKLSTWLYRIAVNESIDFLRKRHNVATMDEAQGMADRLMADRYFDGDRLEALLYEAMARLPDVQRTVFSLRYFDEMPYSEMSQLLNTSEGSLKASYHIAVRKVSEFLRQQS